VEVADRLMPTPENPSLQRRLSRVVSSDLMDTASTVAGFTFTRPQFASAANVSGVRTKTLTFSRRHDSRTLFARDERYGPGGARGAWTGSDRTAVAACRRALRAAHAPAKEVAAIDVLSEHGNVAERLSDDETRVHEPRLVRKVARARRSVEDIPVWSSYATVGLTKHGEVGWLEIHWPDLPPPVVKEAGVLRALVERGYEPPDLPNAIVESVEPGLIHSPAIGFFMDVAAVVRIVYLGAEPGVGRKATLYVDRHGEMVARPRDIEIDKVEVPDRPAPEVGKRRTG
jgi:hypothetical protein